MGGKEKSYTGSPPGNMRSCWAFTSIAVLEANYSIRKDSMTDLSEQNILDCAVDRNGRDAGSCNGGWYGGVFDYLMKKSAVTESKSPYKGKTTFCSPLGKADTR